MMLTLSYQLTSWRSKGRLPRNGTAAASINVDNPISRGARVVLEFKERTTGCTFCATYIADDASREYSSRRTRPYMRVDRDGVTDAAGLSDDDSEGSEAMYGSGGGDLDHYEDDGFIVLDDDDEEEEEAEEEEEEEEEEYGKGSRSDEEQRARKPPSRRHLFL